MIVLKSHNSVLSKSTIPNIVLISLPSSIFVYFSLKSYSGENWGGVRSLRNTFST